MTLRRAALLSLLVAAPAVAAPADQPAEKRKPEASAEVTIPEGSADYRKMLALATRYKKKQISFAQLTAAIVAEKLPPHGLGDGYLLMVPPPPPPGMAFTPTSMPSDWKGTFGEVYMTVAAGQLTEDEYNKVHEVAHRKLPGFPNCKGRSK